MLATFIASRITGTYTFLFVPLLLPSSYVEALLPPHLHLLPTEDPNAPSTSTTRPSTPKGYAWVVVVAGEQKGTGMSVPGGRSTFYVSSNELEAKFEIPYLTTTSVDSRSSISPPLTYKQTLLFSSWSMTLSSDKITGLTSQHAKFQVDDGRDGIREYNVKDWMRLERIEGEETEGEVEAHGNGQWEEGIMREEMTGWWVGDRTGPIATRFTMDPNHPPTQLERINVRLNLAQFSHESIDQVRAHFAADVVHKVDDQGWYEVQASGWECDERTTMKAARLAEL
ncbi:BQ2448_665 [Microbotryum intermedium]|uniref:BQ2448_665 protein n=1 Tax=Microbotryum intermedium TaxID=269621 RepID=A0A238F9K5_9BASI|nr:BQ2448_665 [Microbotryum intermedium]